MKIFFIPRDRSFWQYHASALLSLASIQAIIVIFWQDEKLFNALAGAVWLPLFTFGVLTFRYFYKVRGWYRISTSRTIPGVIFFALVMGALVTLSMFALTVPFFWGHLENHPQVLEHKATVAELLLFLIVGNTFQTQLFFSAWIFIYISIVSNRRIRDAELNNLRLQNSLKESQLANLTNQLNPHFLFNVINNIRFTIYEDAAKADAMLVGLSDMLRYSLESSRQEKVRLKEELVIIDRYIDLIAVQMEKRLTYKVDVASDLHDYQVPPMVLQLLVENAVKHGIDRLRHGGVILLKASVDESHLLFTLQNSRGDSQLLIVDDKKNMGIGLVNIQERLRLLYGDAASLRIEETSDKFSVYLTLPKELSV